MISYAITVCNELEEIDYLLEFLTEHKSKDDEIVVLFDKINGTSEVLDLLKEFESEQLIKLYQDEFKGDFSEWKNKLMPLCSKKWIFNIDADESPTETLMKVIHDILTDNEQIDVIWVPRRNYVEGITDEYIQQMGWTKDSLSRINWPDMQLRIYKNKPEIKWKNKVHEVLTGYKLFSALPTEINYLALYHDKTFERQIKQNQLYEKL